MKDSDTPDKIGKWKVTFILFGIVVVSAVLRFYRIDYQSLWIDELFSIIPTNPDNSLGSVIEYTRNDQPPFFFLYLYYVFKIFGYDESVGRMACAVVGLISIPAIYFLGREVQSQSAGLFAALITGFNYFHLYYSQELRFYSMSFLLTTLSFLFFFRIYKRGKISDFLGYIVFTICLLYTHYFGLFVFFGQFVSFLILLKDKRDLKFILLSLGSGIVVAVSFVPWLPIVMNDLGADLGWIKMPSPIFVAEYFYDYTGKDAFTTIVFVVLIYLYIKSVINGESTANKTTSIILLIWIVVPYLIPYMRSWIISPMLTVRYTIVVLPAWLLLFSLGWDKIKNKKWKYAIVVMLPLSALLNLAFFKKHYTRLEKDQFREASEVVISKNQFHYPVYSYQAWHFNFYFRNCEDKVISMDTENTPQAQRFWFLEAGQWPEDTEAELKHLSNQFKIVHQFNFHEASAYLMERR